MCAWTKELLAETGRESWGDVFRITTLSLESVYQTPLFDGPVWFRPEGREPVKLLVSVRRLYESFESVVGCRDGRLNSLRRVILCELHDS
jgi:hypothetical protein